MELILFGSYDSKSVTFNKADNLLMARSEVQLDATTDTLHGANTNSTNIELNASPDLTTKSVVLVKNSVISPDKTSHENSPTNLPNKANDVSIVDEDFNMLSTKDRDLMLEEE